MPTKNSKAPKFQSITGQAASHSQCVKFATQWANTFDEIHSIQILFDPTEKSARKFKYAVFGSWKAGKPRECTLEGKIRSIKGDEEFIAERPLPDGSILYYRQNKDDVIHLIEYLKSEGVEDQKLLTAKFWMRPGVCRNRRQSSGGGCENISCAGGCSYCEPGHYCCC